MFVGNCLKLTDVGRPSPLFPGGAELYENGETDLSTSKGAYVHSVLRCLTVGVMFQASALSVFQSDVQNDN